MRITNQTLRMLADIAIMAARENAHETVREHGSNAGDAHPEFHGWYLATLEGIVDDHLRNPRSCSDYWPPSYEARPLSDKQITTVRNLVGLK